MIVYEGHGAWALLRLTGTVFPYIWLRVLLVALLTTVVTLLAAYRVIDLTIEIEAHTSVGFVLTLLLSFRLTQAYLRYIEGAQLARTFTSESRSFVRRYCACLRDDDAKTVELTKTIRRYCVAMFISIRNCLMQGYQRRWISEFLLSEEVRSVEASANHPETIACMISDVLVKTEQLGRISEWQMSQLDRHVRNMVAVWGNMEVIHDTPTVFGYSHHIKVFVSMYTFFLPFVLPAKMGLIAPVCAAFIAFAFVGLDEIGVEVEEPFGEELNDIDLLSIVQECAESTAETVQMDIAERGLSDLSPPLASGAKRALMFDLSGEPDSPLVLLEHTVPRESVSLPTRKTTTFVPMVLPAQIDDDEALYVSVRETEMLVPDQHRASMQLDASWRRPSDAWRRPSQDIRRHSEITTDIDSRRQNMSTARAGPDGSLFFSPPSSRRSSVMLQRHESTSPPGGAAPSETNVFTRLRVVEAHHDTELEDLSDDDQAPSTVAPDQPTRLQKPSATSAAVKYMTNDRW
eukprot:TRINITY_DN14582_c0_g1_i1.p1 TRINITY_DN14582_c0_g1~~TRINITY_DN14582_c0_g1_i1.p1  ORF type:complete len:517 (+),score=85.51 TRINITY_DN14582_c0_g1_i1:95-1645(+)